MFTIIAVAVSTIMSFVGQSFQNSRERLAALLGGYNADIDYEHAKTLSAYSIVSNREKENFLITAAIVVAVLVVMALLIFKK